MKRWPDTFEMLHYIGQVRRGEAVADWHILDWLA